MAQQHTSNPFLDLINSTELPFEKILAAQKEQLPPIQPQDLSQKVFIVTGANAGIGFETSKAIAAMNPKKLIMGCRNLQKGNEALNKIKQQTNCQNIQLWELDLNSLDSVKAFAKKFNDSGEALDTLVSNAGINTRDWILSKDGYELTAQVNHIANVLLVLLLTPALKKSPSPRVQIVSSDTHFWVKSVSQDDPTPLTSALKKPDQIPMMLTYPRSKLFNVLFAKEYATRCPHKIWICSTNPGYTDSELAMKDPITGVPNNFERPTFLPMRTTYEGAKTIIQCAITPEVGPNGAYYSEMRESHTNSITHAEKGSALAKNLWKDTMKVLANHVQHDLIEEWAWQ